MSATVNMQKGQKVSLTKEAGGTISTITLGLGWDITPGAGQVDLDASAATFDERGNQLQTIYFGDKTGHAGAIRHSGDNLTGEGEGDDEQIVVKLNELPDSVQTIVFTVTSYRGQKLTAVENAYVRVLNDSANGAELCRYTLSNGVDDTALIIARVYRHAGEWKVAAIGEPASGTIVTQLTRAMRAVL